MISMQLDISKQELSLCQSNQPSKTYQVSTAANGVGETRNSFQTPRGLHIIRAKIGGDCPINTVFVGRRPTGECYNNDLKQRYPNRDWILTRIFWLSGCEVGKNRLGNVDTMRRFIYIHGTPDENPMGQPASKGCIRMHNQDIIELFNIVPVGTRLLIKE